MYFLLGGAGVPNFGDELIVRQWLDFLKSKTRMPITVSGMRADALREVFSGKYPEVNFSDYLYDYLVKLPKGYWSSFQGGLDFFKEKGNFNNPNVQRILESSVFHLHGGGYINNLWPNNAFYLGFCAALKRETGCRLVGTGLGVSPSPNPPEEMSDIFADALTEFDAIEVRDVASLEFLHSASFGEASVSLGLDDVFLLSPEIDRSSRKIHISLHSNEDMDDVAKSIDLNFVESFGRKVFWQCHYRDVKRFKQLKEIIPGLERVGVQELTHEPLPIGGDDFMITSRFHPHMQAARSGIRGQYVAPWKYSKNKHNSVLSLGSSFSRFPDDNVKRSVRMRDVDAGRVKRKQAFWESKVGDFL